MTAASAATGLRTWLQSHNFGWLTPRRMRMITLSAMGAATLVSTVGLSGSTAAQPQPQAQTNASAVHVQHAPR